MIPLELRFTATQAPADHTSRAQSVESQRRAHSHVIAVVKNSGRSGLAGASIDC